MIHKAIIAAFIVLTAAGTIQGINPTAYVINSTGETLSKINLTTQQVTNNILILGADIDSYPNQIVVRDTLAYVICSGTDEIQIINLNDEKTAGWIRFLPGENPYWMAFVDDTTLYVTLLTTNAVARVNPVTHQVGKRTPVGMSPEGIVIIDNTAYIAITAYDFDTWSWGQGKVAVYDVAADTVMAEILVGKNPQFVAIDQRGRLHVACTGDFGSIAGRIYIIDPADNSIVDSLAIGGQPGQVCIGPDDHAFLAAGGWAADGQVLEYDAATGDILHGGTNPIAVDLGATGIASFQDSTVFVACFSDKVVQLGFDGVRLHTYAAGDGPGHLDFNYLPGDVNGDWQVNVGDAVYLVGYIFRGGPSPAYPHWRANANGDGVINIGDAVYLVSYIFRSGPRPRIGPTWMR
jgi:DNA-binding beta-propeller fold protein YncE